MWPLRAGHLPIEHRPADVLDVHDRAGPIDRGQFVVGDLAAARGVAIDEGIAAVAGILRLGQRPSVRR